MKQLRRALLVGAFVIAVFANPYFAAGQANTNDSIALVALYNSTKGAKWYNHANWLTTKPVSTWYGVFLTGGRVDSLSLRNNNLTGTLPPQLGSLTGLVFLSLSHNQLTDTIPASLGQLFALQSLDLSSNSLTGKIPAQLGNLGSLSFIDLSYNLLTGGMPTALFNLGNIQVLNLSNNNLTGNVPSVQVSYPFLTYLDISFNNFSGGVPAWLGFTGNAAGLTVNINNNNFTFAGMEAFAAGNNNGGYYTYAPQAAIPVVENGNALYVSAGGNPAHETFSLYKNGKLSASKTGDSVFTLSSSGVYYITVTNSNASQLTLTSLSSVFVGGPAITIAAKPGSAICAGTTVTFTATAVNFGTTPTYQWKKDGKNVGTNSTTYKDNALKDGDSVECVLTVVGTAYPSNHVKFTVLPVVTPQVHITASEPTTICKGTKVVFTAAYSSAGTAPALQWKKNGKNVGTNNVMYTDSTLKTSDSVYAVLKSDEPCLAVDSAVSKAVKFTVVEAPGPPSAIKGSETVKAGEAKVGYKVNAEPGAVFVWSVPAGNTITAGQGTDSITVKWGSTKGTVTVSVKASNSCGTSATVTKGVTVDDFSVPIYGKAIPDRQPLDAIMYPNPATNGAYIKVIGGGTKVLVTITDITGKQVWHTETMPGTTVALPATTLATGIYFVTITNGREVKELKLAKAN